MDMDKMDKIAWYLGAVCLVIASGCWGWCKDRIIRNDD